MFRTRDDQSWPRPPAWPGVWPVASGQIHSPAADLHLHRPCALHALHLVQGGRGRLRSSAGGEEVLQPGDLFALVPRPDYAYRGDGRDWRFRWIILDGPDAGRFLAACGFSAARPVVRPRSPERLAPLFAGLHLATARRGPGDAFTALARLHDIAAELVAAAPARRERRGPGAEAVVAAAESLLQVSGLGLGIGELAAALGISRSHLLKSVRRARGCSAMAWLHDLRLARARALLAAGDLKIPAVARASGYDNPKYFFRRFRAGVGVSPGGYRMGKRG